MAQFLMKFDTVENSIELMDLNNDNQLIKTFDNVKIAYSTDFTRIYVISLGSTLPVQEADFPYADVVIINEF